jgi:preprotein translocase subunit YajC
LPVFFAQATSGSPLVSYLFLGGMVALMYFFMIRPQRARAKAQQQLTSNLELGDDVTTIGGLHGVIRALDETSVVIELEQGRVRVERRAIASRRNTTS